MVVTALAAAFTGFATLRLKSDYLAITTFGVAVVVQLVALNAASPDRRPLRRRLHPAPLRQPAGPTGRCSTSSTSPSSPPSPWPSILRWSTCRAAPGAGCCGRCAKTNAAAISLGKIRAVLPHPGLRRRAARSWGWPGAVQAHFIGFIAPNNYLPTLTFQVWAMLMVGGSGSNRGAILGSIVVWAIWVGAGAFSAAVVPRRLASARGLAADRRHRRDAVPDPAVASAGLLRPAHGGRVMTPEPATLWHATATPARPAPAAHGRDHGRPAGHRRRLSRACPPRLHAAEAGLRVMLLEAEPDRLGRLGPQRGLRGAELRQGRPGWRPRQLWARQGRQLVQWPPAAPIWSSI